MDTTACRFYDRLESAAPRPGLLLGKVTVFCGSDLAGPAETEVAVVGPDGKALGTASVKPSPTPPAQPPEIRLAPPFVPGPHRLEARPAGQPATPALEFDLFRLFLRLMNGKVADAPPDEFAVRAPEADDGGAGSA
jgi:hypothetical protein